MIHWGLPFVFVAFQGKGVERIMAARQCLMSWSRVWVNAVKVTPGGGCEGIQARSPVVMRT